MSNLIDIFLLPYARVSEFRDQEPRLPLVTVTPVIGETTQYFIRVLLQLVFAELKDAPVESEPAKVITLPWHMFGSGVFVKEALTGVCIFIGKPLALAGAHGLSAVI